MRSFAKGAVALLLGLLVVPEWLFAQDFHIDFYAEIDALVAEARLDEAERKLEEAFLGAPDAAPEDRIALLDTLAEVQLEADKFSDAGDSYWNQASLMARQDGADSPTLSAVYVASGDAYLRGGAFQDAVRAYRAALAIDRVYLACDSTALGALYEALSRALGGAGEAAAADEAAALATDASARCAEEATGRSATVAAATPAEDGDFARVEIFYGTDRAPTGSDRPESFYGGGRGDIGYGRATVSIPRSHRPGQIEAPSLIKFQWTANPSLHVVLLEVEPLGDDDFFSRISETLGARGSDEVFVFIHGFNVTFAEAAKRTAQIAYDLDFEGAPVFYSWPARGNRRSYLADAASVQLSARRLTRFLDDIVARAGARRIHLIAHSMGGRALTEALELYALRHAGEEPAFDQIIFAAPDVDADLFAVQAENFAKVARRITLYTSDADLALEASQRLHGNAPRAGQGGAEALVTASVDTVDMSELGGDLLRHSYFANEASALTDILWLFWRSPPPASRCGMMEESGPQGEYWVYLAERCDENVLRAALTLARQFGARALARLDERMTSLVPGPDLDELRQVRTTLAEILGR
jgi:esterase/lipase superfamily enzyme